MVGIWQLSMLSYNIKGERERERERESICFRRWDWSIRCCPRHYLTTIKWRKIISFVIENNRAQSGQSQIDLLNMHQYVNSVAHYIHNQTTSKAQETIAITCNHSILSFYAIFLSTTFSTAWINRTKQFSVVKIRIKLNKKITKKAEEQIVVGTIQTDNKSTHLKFN